MRYDHVTLWSQESLFQYDHIIASLGKSCGREIRRGRRYIATSKSYLMNAVSNNYGISNDSFGTRLKWQSLLKALNQHQN